MKKKCSKCEKNKHISKFAKSKQTKDGRYGWCKTCVLIKASEFHKTKRGLIYNLYFCQKENSKKRNYVQPLYSLKEFSDWCVSQKKFHKLFKTWKKKDYIKNLRPSCDRLDDYKSYTFENIQLLNWEENKKKGHFDRKNGINNKGSRPVIGINKITGVKVKYYSIMDAVRKTGVSSGNIWCCCSNNNPKYKKHKSAGGFIWKFKKKKI